MTRKPGLETVRPPRYGGHFPHFCPILAEFLGPPECKHKAWYTGSSGAVPFCGWECYTSVVCCVSRHFDGSVLCAPMPWARQFLTVPWLDCGSVDLKPKCAEGWAGRISGGGGNRMRESLWESHRMCGLLGRNRHSIQFCGVCKLQKSLRWTNFMKMRRIKTQKVFLFTRQPTPTPQTRT